MCGLRLQFVITLCGAGFRFLGAPVVSHSLAAHLVLPIAKDSDVSPATRTGQSDPQIPTVYELMDSDK